MGTTTYHDLRAALEFVTGVLIPRRHLYILNIYGGERLSQERQAAVQIVDQEHVFQDGQLGLTLHLSFDPTTCSDYHARFSASPLKNSFTPVSWRGIPCYAACFGTDVDAAMRLTFKVLSTVYFNADALDFDYILHDEGHWDDYFSD